MDITEQPLQDSTAQRVPADYGMSCCAAGRYLRMCLCAMVSTEAQLSGPGTPVVLTFLCRGRISESPAYDVSGLDFQHTPLTVRLQKLRMQLKTSGCCIIIINIIKLAVAKAVDLHLKHA